MNDSSAIDRPTTRQVTTLLWAVMSLEGVAALLGILRMPSEAGSAVFLGYSLQRLLIAGIGIAGVVVFGLCALASSRQSGWWRRAGRWVSGVFASPTWLFITVAGLFMAFLLTTTFLILAVSPAANELVILKAILGRAGLLAAWIELLIVESGLLIAISLPAEKRTWRFFTPLRLALLFGMLSAVYILALKLYMTATQDVRMWRMGEYIALPAAVFLVWGLLHEFFHERAWYARASRWMLLLSIGVITYALYRHTAQWMDWQVTPSKAYWPDLADAWLRGQLYLDLPETTHDLTFYQGHWYVPNPPLPGLFMLPLAFLIGGSSINSVVFSITWGAICTVLVYLVLEQASKLELIPTRRKENLWLTAVFALGTTFWWLSVMGRMWFLSQVLTVLCVALATLFVLKRYPGWLAGLCLGLAMLSRPNVAVLWPFLAGIELFLRKKGGDKVRWQAALGWTVQSAVPLGLATAGLLYYNYMRFNNFFDFGYVTITSSDWMMDAVQTYGMFNVHFIPTNLYAMFVRLPAIRMNGNCPIYFPGRDGISILAMTPAIVYAVRRFRWNAWTVGAWISVLLSTALLLLYSNYGAWQLGYRYLMDFILPVLLLMAIGVGQRSSWVFKGLAVLSLLGNAAGMIWWFNRWWC